MADGAAWVQWWCGCDQAASSARDLPRLCPGHATNPRLGPDVLPDVDGDPISIGHWCPRHTRCPGVPR